MNPFYSITLILFIPFILLRLEGKKIRLQNLFIFKPNSSDLINTLKLFVKTFFSLFVLGVVLNAFHLMDSHKIVDFIRVQPLEILFLMIFFAPLAEELLFRGYLQHKIGVIFSSVIFALLHYGYGSIAEVLGAFVISLILGEFMRKNKRLLPCVLAHAMYNAFSVLIVTYFL